jgi:hypothetical protein
MATAASPAVIIFSLLEIPITFEILLMNIK